MNKVDRIDLIMELRNIYKNMNDNVNVIEINRQIELYLEDVDSYKVLKSHDFQLNKSKFIDEYTANYMNDLGSSYRPVGLDVDERKPITAKGVVAFSIYDSYHAFVEGFERFENFDSIASFERQWDRIELRRKEHAELFSDNPAIPEYDELDHIISTSEFYEKYELNKGFDDVSIGKFDTLAKDFEHDFEETRFAHMIDYQEYVASNPADVVHSLTYGDYIETIHGFRYDDDLALQEELDRRDFHEVSELNVRVTPKKVLKNYQQLLYGLYDKNSHEIFDSGLMKPFEKAVDNYFEWSGLSESDQYVDSEKQLVDIVQTHRLLYVTGLELGVEPNDLKESILLIDEEDRSHIIQGVRYATRDQIEIGEPGRIEERGRWLMDGFEATYGRTMDYNVKFIREREKYQELDDVTDEVLEQMRVDLVELDESKAIHDDPEYDLNMRRRMSPSFHLTKEPEKAIHNMGLFLTKLQEKDLNVNVSIKKVFEQKMNDITHQWGYSIDEYRTDPDTFIDMLAVTTNQTLNEIDPKENYYHNEGHMIIANALGHHIDEKVIEDFSDGYRLVYDVPMDASLLTVNEVNQEMGHKELDMDEIIGELNYYDRFNAKSQEDIDYLILQKTLGFEMKDDVSAVEDQYDSYIDQNSTTQFIDEYVRSMDDGIVDDGPEL